jgi:hypothetical protein
MPFCTSCGAEVAADKKFCPQCGTPLEPETGPAVPKTPAAPKVRINPPSPRLTPAIPPKKPKTALIIGSIVVILVIAAAVYFVGLPMLKANQRSADDLASSPTPSVTYKTLPTPLLTPQYTPDITETTILPVQQRDDRLEEDYEPIYALNQKFSFGQKITFAHNLTRPPLYIRFNLTPTQIVRHRLVSALTNNEHYENTTENSPQSWFEVKVLDAGSGAVIDQEGFGNDYSDITKQSFMVRQDGNYRIEMSGNEVVADIQMLIGTT